MNITSGRRYRSVAPIVLLAFVVAGCGGGKVWDYASTTETPKLPAQAVAGGQFVTVRFDLAKLQSSVPEQIELPLPDKSSLVIVRSGFERHTNKGFTWRGKVKGDEYSIATLSILDNVLVGDIVMSNGNMYRIDQIDDGIQIIFALNPAAFPPEATPLTASKPISVPMTIQAATCAQDENTVEMLVVYTEKACASAAHRSSCTPFARTKMLAKIQQAEDETNTLFANSLISPTVKIVHVQSAGDYADDAQTLQQNLDRLRLMGQEETDEQNVDTAYLDDIHAWRDQYGADVVTLITKATGDYDNQATEQDEGPACGLSTELPGKFAWFEKDAFSVVPADCIVASFSFGHELGHLMGADHDSDSSRAPTSLSGNRGYIEVQTPVNQDPWRTVMSENNDECMNAKKDVGCARIPYFSNRTVKKAGQDMGNVDADNSHILGETIGTVAMFRQSLSCNAD